MIDDPAEWTQFYDEDMGRYRWKHMGNDLIRDKLFSVGKRLLGKTTKKAAKTAATAGFTALKTAATKAGEKTGQLAAEKGMAKISQILGKQKRGKQTTKITAPKSEQQALSRRERLTLINIMISGTL